MKKSLYQYYIDRCNDILNNPTSKEKISKNHFSDVEYDKCIKILFELNLIEKFNDGYKLSEFGNEIVKKNIQVTIDDIETEIILKQSF